MTMIKYLLILALLSTALSSCSPIAAYALANTHLETNPRGAGVCVGLPIVPVEICLTAQGKNPSGDIALFGRK